MCVPSPPTPMLIEYEARLADMGRAIMDQQETRARPLDLH